MAGLGVDDLQGCAPAFGSATFHEALEALRTMLAGEVNGTLRHAFVAAEGRVLPNLPVGIGAEEQRIEEGGRERGAAVPFGRDAWKQALELAQEGASTGCHAAIGVG